MNLVGVPLPLHDESFSSWLTRITINQGVSVTGLLRFMGLEGVRDLDLSMAGRRGPQAIVKTGVSPDKLALAGWIFSGVRQINQGGRQYLLYSKLGKVRFRICPVCLLQPGIKYYPVHWRFKCWVWCPIHDCIMLDGCPHCRCAIVLPVTMLSAGADGHGVASLDRCMSCSQKMSAPLSAVARPLLDSLLYDWEILCVKNGRAVLAALLHRNFRIEGQADSLSIRELNVIHGTGVLPNNQKLFSEHTFADRIEERKRHAQ